MYELQNWCYEKGWKNVIEDGVQSWVGIVDSNGHKWKITWVPMGSSTFECLDCHVPITIKEPIDDVGEMEWLISHLQYNLFDGKCGFYQD